MNTLLEQLLINEISSLVSSGDATKIVTTLISYFSRVTPDIATLWEDALTKVEGSATTSTASPATATSSS